MKTPLLTLAIMLGAFLSCPAQQEYHLTWTTEGHHEILEILQKLTLEEKVSLLCGMGTSRSEFGDRDVPYFGIKGIPGKGIPEGVPVRDIMDPDPVSITPDTLTVDAIELMREHGVSCLPVLKDDRLVGLVSEREFMPIAYQLLMDRLGRE